MSPLLPDCLVFSKSDKKLVWSPFLSLGQCRLQALSFWDEDPEMVVVLKRYTLITGNQTSSSYRGQEQPFWI